MTTTPPAAPPGPPPQDHGQPGPRVTGEEVRDLGRLRRSRSDRKVAGVAGGLARHLDVDPLVLRIAFVVLVFFGGAGLILYGACWLLVPDELDNHAIINLDDRSRTVALLIVAAIAAAALIGDSWGAFGFPWPIAVVALIALWLLTRNNPRPPLPPAPVPGAAPAAAYPPSPEGWSAAATTQTYAYPVAPPYQQAPTPYVAPPPYVRPPNPRKRGPILFWFTLALIALGLGILTVVDLAGADVAASAYPALAVATSGVMLVVGAFYGRAGGIILVGLLSAGLLAFTSAAERWESDDVRVTPTSAADVDSRYWLSAGEQVIDLSDVTDPEALDGRRIEVEGGIGRIEVILPAELGARVVADVDGPGHLLLFGDDYGGIDVRKVVSEGDTVPRIVLDTHLGVGEIEVSQR